MLRNIEKAFNLIWRARENRSPVSSFLLYWAVLSLAPVAMGIALGMSTYLSGNSVLHSLLRKTTDPRLFVLPAGPTPPNPAERRSVAFPQPRPDLPQGQ